MTFNRGTDEEEERDMIVVDKEGYDLHKVTEDDVGKTFRIIRPPMYFTVDQWNEVQNWIATEDS